MNDDLLAINSRPSMIDSLNQIMDTSHVLSEAELQNELDIFANVQFTFDNEPNDHKSEILDYKRPSVQHDIRSLLNIKLASLVDPHDPTILSSGNRERTKQNLIRFYQMLSQGSMITLLLVLHPMVITLPISHRPTVSIHLIQHHPMVSFLNIHTISFRPSSIHRFLFTMKNQEDRRMKRA